jgi:nucleotide-binding universal stress UspA family protein
MFRKLLVPLDTSPMSEQAAWKAAALARVTHATVHLVHVYEPRLPAFDGGAVIDEQILAMERAQYERHLRRVADDLARHAACKVQLAILSGVPADAILKYARQQGADLLVMTTHGRTGVSRAWFGSVADTLARSAALPVLLVRPNDGEPPVQLDKVAGDMAFRRVVIALDGSDAAERVLESVRALKVSPHAEVLLLEVVRPVSLPIMDVPNAGVITTMAPDLEATDQLVAIARKYLHGIERRLAREGTARVESRVLISASAGPSIVDAAKQFGADLVAITSHGRGASRLLLGSVGDKILRGTHCSILLRRASAAPRTRRTPQRKRTLAGKRS